MFDDLTPRYAPDKVIIANWNLGGPGGYVHPVTGSRFYPANVARPGPIHPNMGALELQTDGGSRWYGCIRAYINSELRMIVVGANSHDEVRMKWETVPADKV